MSTIVLQLDRVTVERTSEPIVRGVSLSIPRGSIHALVGANGSGKSTLAQAIMGSAGYDVTKGRIYLDGEDITRLDMTTRARRGLTLAMQEPARIEGLSVRRYLALGMAHPDDVVVDDALNQVGLSPNEYVERAIDESLSGGERKRIELAAVICMQPKVAVLDECDSGIDAQSMPIVVRAIKRLAHRGTAILLISHASSLATAADTASLLVSGHIIQTGSARQVCAQYARLAQSVPECSREEVAL